VAYKIFVLLDVKSYKGIYGDSATKWRAVCFTATIRALELCQWQALPLALAVDLALPEKDDVGASSRLSVKHCGKAKKCLVVVVNMMLVQEQGQ
jgi:hypothetical protein